MRRRSERPAVVFPQPLSPTSPSVSADATAKEMSSTARTWPTTREKTPFFTGKYFLRFRTSIKGGIKHQELGIKGRKYKVIVPRSGAFLMCGATGGGILIDMRRGMASP